MGVISREIREKPLRARLNFPATITTSERNPEYGMNTDDEQRFEILAARQAC
jgi:hypothetical protein